MSKLNFPIIPGIHTSNIIVIILVLLASSACQESDDPVPVQKEIMVLSEMDHKGVYQLYIRDIDGDNPVQLTFNGYKSWMTDNT